MIAHPKVNFCTAFVNAFKNYSNFSGRIRRSEYWFFLLVVNTLTVLLTLFFILFATGTIGGHYYNSYYDHYYDYDYYHYGYYRTNDEATLALLIVLSIYISFIMLPTLSATVRRLHDTGRRGEYIFVGLVPFFGEIALLVFLCQDSMTEANEFGPSPKYSPFIVNPNLQAQNQGYIPPLIPNNNNINNVPKDNIIVPNNNINMVPSNYIIVPNNQYVVPNNHIIVPNNNVIVPNNQYIVPNNNFIPNNNVTIPNNNINAPNNNINTPNNNINSNNSEPIQMNTLDEKKE